jgi:hypothetical protein
MQCHNVYHRTAPVTIWLWTIGLRSLSPLLSPERLVSPTLHTYTTQLVKETEHWLIEKGWRWKNEVDVAVYAISTSKASSFII